MKWKTLHRLFEEQVERTPGNTAVIFKKQKLTYRELDEKTNRLARLLRSKGIGPDCLVAVMVERSMEMMIALMAVLKSGGAYMPLSPDYPGKRIHQLLVDSEAKVILTQGKFPDKIKTALDTNLEILNLESDECYRESPAPLVSISGPRNLAYVIYTSGSTGIPKGVMIEHRSVVNRLNWMQKQYPLTEKDTILQKTPFFFDVSVWELFWWSMVGAAVCFLLPGFEKFPQAIVETVETDHITVMHFVPSMMSAFLGYMENSGELHRLAGLRQVFVSGEALKPSHLEQFNRTLYKQNHTRLTNLYGPTEATVDVSYFDCPTGIEPSVGTGVQSIPIGKPIDNLRLYVMDEDSREQPPGVEGELCIGGIGLARGYLNRPTLTFEKFCLRRPGPRRGHPISERSFSMAPGAATHRTASCNHAIMQPCNHATMHLTPHHSHHSPFTTHHTPIYKTGDRARQLEDGNIEFLGRMDFQVKIRGLRIELGEIESVLSRHPAVRDCAVIVKETTETIITLVAYLVKKTEVPEAELKKYMKALLPEYMVPGEFVVLEALPLTPTGKVDRKKLNG